MNDINSFDQWKSFLSDRLEEGRKEGLSQEVISDLAYEIGNYLSENVTPDIPENKILSDLWNVASPEEQHAIANLMVKLVQK
ncbi:DUF3243 family protein [Pseudoneobacillus sp. C159]